AMIEVDRLMIEDYGISLIQMMENAGRCLAVLGRQRFLGGDVVGARVAVLAGSGGNGGGAITAGRRLAAWGADVYLGLTRLPEAMKNVPRRQFDIARRFDGVSLLTPDSPGDSFDLILDGLVGYSLSGTPSGTTADWIAWANRHAAPIVSLDVPSGFDSADGSIREPAIRADATLTLALPKRGLRGPGAKENTGALYCADISVPPGLYARLKPPVSVATFFGRSDIVRVGRK
ncbi:MAG: NAD(P)H-hydrate epimerase, partial [Hyphomicrobiales bacterium]|nr:NAD(P)H-hydrate epimerase [Hyphomicrobiales bacterium]